jgi:hypothetical protein
VESAKDEAYYGFAADAALAAASAAALAAAAESAAAEAAASAAGAAAGGGVVSTAGAGASVLLPQALSMNAATKAVRASLVFIYRYPRNLRIKKFRPSVLFLGRYPNVLSDFRVFWLIFISLSRAAARLKRWESSGGLKAYSLAAHLAHNLGRDLRWQS